MRSWLPSVGPSAGARFPGIEGLRAVAAGSVLVTHAWFLGSSDGPEFVGTLLGDFFDRLSLGVTLFFTLSGFLLYRPFAAALLRGKPRPSVARYLRNRALRILPAYWVILAVVALVLGAALVPSGDRYPETGAIHGADLLAREALLVQGYGPGTFGTGIGPAWSLAVEAVFYLVLPLLALLAAAVAGRNPSRLRRRLAVLTPPFVLLAVGLSGKGVAAFLVPGVPDWSATWHTVVARSFWSTADLFTFGMLVAVVWTEVADGSIRLPRWWRLPAWGAVLVIPLAAEKLLRTGVLHLYSYETVMATAFAAVLALVVLRPAGAPTPRLVRLLETPPLVATGLISYSIFLWHEPLVRWLELHGLTVGGRGGLAVNIALLAAVSWLLSAVTYRLVELPALRRKGRARPAAEPQAVPAHQLQAAP